MSIMSEANDNGNAVEEPTVCRIFAETTTPASFFDFIGNNEYPDSESSANNETYRRRDAWIPNESAKQAFLMSTLSQPASYFAEQDLLTMPGVAMDADLDDPVNQVVNLSLGEAEGAQRRCLTADDVTPDERGLRELVQAGYLRAAINLTSRLLRAHGQGKGKTGHPSEHTPHSLQLWFTRLTLLIKTRLLQVAETEAEPFNSLDKPDVYYQFYQRNGVRQGSMARFSFRLLIAEIPMHCGKPVEALSKLLALAVTIRQMLHNLEAGACEDGSPHEISASDRDESTKLWKNRHTRVQHSIVNCAVANKDFELAIEVLTELTRDETSTVRGKLYSALGRLHLQLGDVCEAEVYFNKYRDLDEEETGYGNVRDLVDRGLVAVAQNAFHDAYTYFQQANTIDNTNIMVINNMGVCLLYKGRLKEAIAILESGVASNPSQGLHEALLLNLCTLYDMESSKTHSKKLSLLKQIARFQADAPVALLEKLYA